MSKYQRTRGATYEREVANALTQAWGVKVKRHIGQARDGGEDIKVPPFRIECKRRKGIAVYEWLDQCMKGAELSETPIVIARADGRESIAIMRLEDFIKLGREEVAASIFD